MKSKKSGGDTPGPLLKWDGNGDEEWKAGNKWEREGSDGRETVAMDLSHVWEEIDAYAAVCIYVWVCYMYIKGLLTYLVT